MSENEISRAKWKAYHQGARTTTQRITLANTLSMETVLTLINEEVEKLGAGSVPMVSYRDVRFIDTANTRQVTWSYTRTETMDEWAERTGWRDPEQEGCDFSVALRILKEPEKRPPRVARHGWNGKDMFIRLVTEQNPFQTYLQFKAADGTFVPWVASQTDLLANDWYQVKEWA